MTIGKLVAETSLRLRDVVSVHRPAVLASSFGAEDMVILDLISRLRIDVEVFTLDTGRLHGETHQLIDQSREKYVRPIRIMHPDAGELESFTLAHGNNPFYQSVEMRKRCCAIRKVAPLKRALQGKRLWITGMRREQSITRTGLELLAYDQTHGLFKLSPLLDWTAADVAAYVRENEVPVNALHARGYPSIGCAPCTRAIEPGEDERAGRWWWEQAQTRECGLHLDPGGRLVRATTRSSKTVST